MKVIVDLPDNMFNVLKALTKYTRNTVETDIFEMLAALLAADLECPELFGCTQEDLNVIVKQCRYRPNEWRVRRASA